MTVGERESVIHSAPGRAAKEVSSLKLEVLSGNPNFPTSPLPLPTARETPYGVTATAPGSALWWAAQRLHRGLRDWTREVLAYKSLIALASVFLVVALYADYRCGVYVTATKGVKVPDLILDHLPPVDMSFLFIYGYIALIAGMFAPPLFFRARMIHIVTIQFSLLLIIRSLFMIFTHMETPAGSVPIAFPWIFKNLYFENDMFFSGHTAMPFLGFYLFKGRPYRYVFLVGSLVMGIVVLCMHLHYSIDVLGAFFMVYCSYQIGNALLQKLDPTYQGL